MPDNFQQTLAGFIEPTLQVVEAAGGRRLPEPCAGRDLGPAGDRPHSPERDHTTHCEQRARFALPYNGEEDEEREIVACAIDDRADAWPYLAGQGWA